MSDMLWCLTFENGADVFPYGYGSRSMELPQRQLHVEERHATKDGHQNVGNEKSSCVETYDGTVLQHGQT